MSGAKKKLAQKEAMAQMGLTEKEKKELKETAAKKRNTILGVIAGVIVVVLVVLLLVWNSGFFARHTTALEVKDHKFTVADMNYWYLLVANQTYQQEQYYAQLYQSYADQGVDMGGYTARFDPNVDYKAQYVDDEQTQTYHDYFLEQAKNEVTRIVALVDAANAEGYTPDEETQKNIDNVLADLKESAKSGGYSNANHLLQLNYGRTTNEQVYVKNAKLAMLASGYENAARTALTDYSDEDMKAYYDEHSDLYNSYDYNYVYFDGQPVKETDDDGNTIEPTDEQKSEAMADAKEKAENLVKDVKDAQTATLAEGETRKDFAAVAATYTTDNTVRTRTLGADFQSAVYFDWLTDSARKDGDIEMFESEGNGYYVIQFHDAYLYDEPTVDVRHILIQAETSEDAELNERNVPVPTKEQMDAAHDKAEELMKEFNAKSTDDKTAAAFGELAEEHSDDGRDTEGKLSKSGGLYTDVHKGTMVQNFNDWIFDESRQVGDVGLVENAGPDYYGWHVVYFQASHEPEWLGDSYNGARVTRTNADTTAWNESLLDGYEAVEASGFSQVGK